MCEPVLVPGLLQLSKDHNEELPKMCTYSSDTASERVDGLSLLSPPGACTDHVMCAMTVGKISCLTHSSTSTFCNTTRQSPSLASGTNLFVSPWDGF